VDDASTEGSYASTVPGSPPNARPLPTAVDFVATHADTPEDTLVDTLVGTVDPPAEELPGPRALSRTGSGARSAHPSDDSDGDFDFYGRPMRPVPEEVAPPRLPVAVDPAAEEPWRMEAEARRVVLSSALMLRGRGLAASSAPGPRSIAGGLAVSENVGFAMSNFVRSLTGGGPRGLPREVFEHALRLGVSAQMEGCLPPPGTSVIANAETVMERRMERPGLCLYVGITEAPAQRWHEHRSGLARPVAMTVVQQAPSSRHTTETERALIAIATRRWGHRCRNVLAGGQGASVGTPHYAYIVWSEGPVR